MIIVVGLGETGSPLFEHLKEAGLNVKGIDIKPIEISEPVEIMHFCVPKNSQEEFIKLIEQYLLKYNPELTIIEATVPPGTTKKLVEKTGKAIVNSPIRGMHKNMKEELKHYTKYIGTDDPRWGETAAKHFQKIGWKTKIVNKSITTEFLKILSTSYYGVLIGWAQEMNRIFSKYEIDYQLINEWNKEIDEYGIPRPQMRPGVIGGHCVMENINLLKEIIDSDYLDAVEKSNKWTKKHLGEGDD